MSRFRRYHVGSLVFDEGRRELLLAQSGEPFELPEQLRQLLEMLLQQPGVVVTYKEIFRTVWSDRLNDVTRNSLDNAVHRLRKEVGPAGLSFTTARNSGYRLDTPVVVSFYEADAGFGLETLAPDQDLTLRPGWRLAHTLDEAVPCRRWLAIAESGERRLVVFADTSERLAAFKELDDGTAGMVAALGDRANILPILDRNFAVAPYFVAFGWRGPSLRDWAAAPETLADFAEAGRVAMVADLARTVAVLASIGRVHGGITPDAIFVDAADPAAPRLGLFDIGARPEGQAATMAGDVSALGLLLYRMVVGDLNRSLAADWQQDIPDTFLRADIADSARKIESAAALAVRLETLGERRAAAAQVEADRAELERQRIAADDARERARRTTQGLAAALALTIIMTGLAVYAQRQNRRSALAINAAYDTVTTLVGGLAQQLHEQQGLSVTLALHLLTSAQRTLDRVRALAPRNPTGQRLYAETLNGFADVYWHAGDNQRAVAAATKAAKLFAPLVGAAPKDDALRLDLASAWSWAGDAKRELHDYAGARTAYLAAQAAFAPHWAPTDLANLPPMRVAGKLAETDYRKGHAALAMPVYRRLLTQLAPIASTHPGEADVLYENALLLEDIGDALTDLPDPAGALAAYREDGKMRERLVALAPLNKRYRESLVVSLLDQGDAYEALRHLPEAAAAYRQALEGAQGLSTTDPDNARLGSNVVVALSDLADVAMDGQDWLDAQKALQKGVARSKDWSGRQPENVAFLLQTINLQAKLAKTYQQVGKSAEAREAAIAARDLTRALPQGAGDQPTAAMLAEAAEIERSVGVTP